MMTIDQTYNGSSVDLPVGQSVELRLPENPTTGFSWAVRADGGPACSIADGPRAPSGSRPGQGGEHAWEIRGIQVGTCQIALAYRRPWETAAAPAQEFHVDIRVTR